MQVIEHIDPFVDWAMVLADARDGDKQGDELYFPVFFEGHRATINEALQTDPTLDKNDVRIFLPDSDAPGEELVGDGLRPLLRENISTISGDNASSVSGYYFTRRSDFLVLARAETVREFILGVGTPVRIPDEPAPDQFDLRNKPAFQPNAPIVAIIDEGIGYLNARFRRFEEIFGNRVHKTRFLALWQQSVKPVTGMEGATIEIGRVLTPDMIESDLAQLGTRTEGELYADRNAEIFGNRTHRSTEQSFSHGTAVLDLAAGANPTSREADVDILAVQLPPETLEDTSGTQLPPFLLMGLDWLLAYAASEARPIIVNISLGYSAGTKTGDALLEKVMRERLAAFNAQFGTDGNGRPAAQLVFAFGNSHRERLNARVNLTNQLTDAEFGWAIQPEDPTPSFLQIHRTDTPKDDLRGDISITIESPSGRVFNVIPHVEHSEDILVPDEAGVQCMVGRVYQDRSEGTARITIAMAPTATVRSTGLVAEAGMWSVKVHRVSTEDVPFVLQVQRDDTATGFARGGRQSYLDHQNGYALDPRTENYELPEGTPGLTRKGTNSALMARAGNAIYLVGSFEPDASISADAIRPTRESAASDQWSERAAGPGPTFAAQSEDGVGNPGVIASGTFSDTTVLVNGTSVAAAKLTRDLSGLGPALDVVAGIPDTDQIGGARRGRGGARERHPEI